MIAATSVSDEMRHAASRAKRSRCAAFVALHRCGDLAFGATSADVAGDDRIELESGGGVATTPMLDAWIAIAERWEGARVGSPPRDCASNSMSSVLQEEDPPRPRGSDTASCIAFPGTSSSRCD
jgi:hypothetical protein